MEKDNNSHIINHKLDFLVLLVLVALAFTSVALAGTKLGNIAVTGTLLLSGVQAYLILWHFMRLRYQKRVYSVLIGLVLFLFIVVLAITFQVRGV